MDNKYVGIDVSKHELVIYFSEETYAIENTTQALKCWYKKHDLALQSATLFAFEATGGYEKILAKFLSSKSLPARCVHPNHVRAYAQAMGQLAKTDKIDAKIISMYAEMKGVLPGKILPVDEVLVGLVSRRDQLLELIKQENNRLETLDVKIVVKAIKEHLRYLKRHLNKIDEHIEHHVKSDKILSQRIDLLCSIPGVGFVTSVSIMAYLPEIFEFESQSLVALAGLAPMNRDSGRVSKRRHIRGGRSRIRRSLYMAALSARRSNPDMKRFYDRLSSNGKAYKVASTAVMRKLLLLMQVVCLRGTPWEACSTFNKNGC